MNIDHIARQYLATKAARDAADLALTELSEALKSYMEDNNMEGISIDGRTIKLIRVNQRSFDVEQLKELVSRSVFSQVTEPKVKTSVIDAFVKIGKIETEVLDKVVKVNTYEQLRVK